MNFEQERAILFGENLIHFANYVRHSQDKDYLFDPDKLFRLKNLIDEYRLQALGAEIVRLNQFCWEPRESERLIERASQAIANIDEYIQNNMNGLFIFSARVYTLKKHY
ncbi:hypothetical protein ABE096_18970 [Robertmurraya massiliosenegalensis]|uniref:hypothetical protein n=1 Tax=Robertmurraya TaxID=2837507 RepID=UPI0039A674A8